MPATDNHATQYGGSKGDPGWPPSHVITVTPDNSNDLAFVTTCIWVGVSGDLAVVTKDGDDLVLPAVAAGMWHPIRASRIKATGTTATGIRAGE